jgi:hypothetical protein
MKYITGTYFKTSQYNYFSSDRGKIGRDVYLCIFVLLLYMLREGSFNKQLDMFIDNDRDHVEHTNSSLSLSVNGHYINRSISCIENVCVCVCGNGPEGEFLDLLSQSQIFFVPPEGGNYIFVQVDMGQDFSTIHDEYLFSKFLKLEGNCSTR